MMISTYSIIYALPLYSIAQRDICDDINIFIIYALPHSPPAQADCGGDIRCFYFQCRYITAEMGPSSREAAS